METGKKFVWKGQDEKKRQKMVVQHFFEKATWISRFFILVLEILDKTKLHPWKSYDIPENYLTPLGSETKFFVNFSLLHLKILFYFLFNLRKFHILFLQYSWKIQVLE